MNNLRLLLLSAWGLAALLAGPPAQAQRARPSQGGRLTQLDNAKIAFLTARLTLTREQAQRFWPLYNDFVARHRALNRTARQLRRAADNPNLSEAQLRDNFTQDFALRQQQFDGEKDYFEQAQQVLSLRQLAQLYQAERDFTKEVLQRVAGRPAGPAPAGP